jgi:competence protein ComEC
MALVCFGLIRGLTLLLPEKLYHRLTLNIDPRKTAAWLTLPLVVFYTLLAGGQVATVRSLIMISAGLMALILDRDHALLHSLALAAFSILLTSPQALFDISFQLSFLSVLVIAAVVTLWSELGIQAQSRLQRLRNSLALVMIISLATTLTTGPLVARYFNQVSLAGIISNLIVVPFAGIVVVPLGLFSGLVSLFTHSLPLAWLNQFAADVFIAMVTFFSRLPFAEFHPPTPGILWLVCYAIFLLFLLPLAKIRLLSRFKPFEISSRVPLLTKAALALSGAFLILSTALSLLPKHETILSFLDVGQGDCTLIELASGKTILLDGGGLRDNRFDVGRRVVAPYLWNRGIRTLDLVILSHPHPDHLNGMLFLLRKFNVREVWSSGLDRDLPGYETFRIIAEENQVSHHVKSGEDPAVILGNAELRVLHPKPGFFAQEQKAYAAENDRSLVVRIVDRSRIFLFTGDIGKGSEASLNTPYQCLKCDVLKVPHHGSRSSSSDAFVSQARPGIAVVTAGRENPYRHPSPDVIERYEKAGAFICRTDRDGAVIIRTNQEGMEVSQWSELMLRRIVLHKPEEWKAIERQNWLRIWKRMSAGI